MSAKILSKQTQSDVIRNLVEDKQSRNYYGKLTISFENGNVVNVKAEDSLSPETLFSKYGKPRPRIVVTATKPVTPEGVEPEPPMTDGDGPLTEPVPGGI